MSTFHKQSTSVPLPQFDLWGVPPTQHTVERSIETEHRPISTLNSLSFIEFNIPTALDEYILFNETYLYMRLRARISKPDKTDITDDDWNRTVPANYLLHSMFKQIEVQINGKELVLAPQTYAYRAYLEALLGFSADAKKSHLTASLWCDDKLKRAKFLAPTDGEKDRGKGSEVDLMGRLHLDLTFQSRALLGGSHVKIKLTPHSSSFFLSTPNNVVAEVDFLDATLFVHRSKITPRIVSAHTKALAVSPAKYPLTRAEVRQITIPKGVMDAMLDNIVAGQLPRRIFIVCVDNEAFNGSLKKDPFFFNHYNINYLACFLDGTQYPIKAYQPDFDNNLFIREYMGLFKALNQNSTDTYACFDRNKYKNGNTIFGINFAPDLSNGCDSVGYVK